MMLEYAQGFVKEITLRRSFWIFYNVLLVGGKEVTK